LDIDYCHSNYITSGSLPHCLFVYSSCNLFPTYIIQRIIFNHAFSLLLRSEERRRKKKKSSTTSSSGRGVEDDGTLKDNDVITATVDAVVTPNPPNSNNDVEEQLGISEAAIIIDDCNIEEGIPSPILYDDPNNTNNAGEEPSFTHDGLIVATAIETLDNED
jgi:hypothetical protein